MGKKAFFRTPILWVIMVMSYQAASTHIFASPSSMEGNGMMMPPSTHSENRGDSEMSKRGMSDSMMSDQSMPSYSMPSQNGGNDFYGHPSMDSENSEGHYNRSDSFLESASVVESV